MKTILNHNGFMKRLRIHCARERIEIFYLKSCFAKTLSLFKRPRVYMPGDLGDEVFNALYSSIHDIGMDRTMNLSPSDVVEMKPTFKDVESDSGKVRKYTGMLVAFKDFDAETFAKETRKR